MMSRQDIIDIVRMGCKREDTGFNDDQQLEYIKKGLKGDLDENILEKLLPDATPNVKKYGFLKYFLYYHNLKKGKIEMCIAYPGDIIGKKDSKYVVKRIDGKEFETDSEAYPGIKVLDERELKIGSHVITHQDKIRLILDEKRNQEARSIFNSYLRDSKK